MPETKEILTHRADVKLRVSAESLQRLFEVSLRAMNQLLEPDFETMKKETSITERIRITSADKTALLIDFLSETLTLSHLHKALFVEVHFKSLSERELIADLKGVRIDEFKEDLKAVTYHEADIRKTSYGAWETILIFDI